ncbi:hypothetical protein SAMN04489712_12133 [Thermomonospora echinospora]|uniref:Response regulatory domain-containing protein n=1 Tax=Thermomonospora echinospora TaxID=1992 RepID=A0A1H6DRK0_9ACTN|nr:hypothetical protein SAMN04489712_12133 [Thermomonospora echinospora]
MTRVLVVDDSPQILATLRRKLERDPSRPRRSRTPAPER